MKGFLLDTNVPSELTRPRPESKVIRRLDEADDETLFFSVLSLGEIVKGLTAVRDEVRHLRLRDWLDGTLRPWFQGRILPVTEPIAERWGVLAGRGQSQGHTFKVIDGLLAATALEHNLSIV